VAEFGAMRDFLRDFVEDTANANTHTGNGECWVTGWATPNNPSDCRVNVQFHTVGGFGWGSCAVTVRKNP
jgi:hypothetical protein